MNPAKQTVVAEGVSMFMEEMGSLMGQTSPDEEDDHDNHDKKDGSCIQSSSGLPFIGDIFKTISCVVGMASDISHTFGGDPNANPPHEGGDPEKYLWLDGKFMLQFDPQHEPDRAALEL